MKYWSGFFHNYSKYSVDFPALEKTLPRSFLIGNLSKEDEVRIQPMLKKLGLRKLTFEGDHARKEKNCRI